MKQSTQRFWNSCKEELRQGMALLAEKNPPKFVYINLDIAELESWQAAELENEAYNAGFEIDWDTRKLFSR